MVKFFSKFIFGFNLKSYTFNKYKTLDKEKINKKINFNIIASNKEKIGLVIKTIRKGYYLKGLDETKVVIRNALLECYVEE